MLKLLAATLHFTTLHYIFTSYVLSHTRLHYATLDYICTSQATSERRRKRRMQWQGHQARPLLRPSSTSQATSKKSRKRQSIHDICRRRRGHCPWRFFCHLEKFQMWKISDVEKFGEIWMWSFNVQKFEMQRLFWHQIVFHGIYMFCCKICFVGCNAVLLRNLFCRDSRTFYVEKIQTQTMVCGEKMSNIMCEVEPAGTSCSKLASGL